MSKKTLERRTLLDSISSDEVNIRTLAEYLRFLIERRYGPIEPSALDADTLKLRVIATEYHIGMRPLNEEPSGLYGELVARLARSPKLARALDPQPNF